MSVTSRPILLTGAIIKTLVLITVGIVVGGVLVSVGWNWLVEGQMVVHPKGGTEYIAYPTGPTALAFHLRVWSLIAAGSALLVAAVGIVFQLFSSRHRRQMLQRIDAQSFRSRSGPRVPGWFVAAVLLSLFGFFVMMVLKWA